MAYSFSGIKSFKNCQRQYYETKVLKKYPFPETEAILYGKDVHKALEDYINEGIPLGKHSRFKGVADALNNIKGEKLTEYEMGLDESLNPCGFNDENCFIRGIADLIIIDGGNGVAHIFDYKTGSAKYPDTDQLELMALMVFRHFPNIAKVKAGLLFIVHDTIISAEYEKKDAKKKWLGWLQKIEVMEQAAQSNVYQENPSGLCGWCVVVECPHHKPRRK